jgi:hypothetical protein
VKSRFFLPAYPDNFNSWLMQNPFYKKTTMKKNISVIIGILLMITEGYSQGVSIGTATPNASSKLDISSTTTGVLIPRMTTAQRNAIVSPALGLLVFDTDKLTIYMHSGPNWVPLNFCSNTTLPGLPVSASDGMSNDYFGYSVRIDGDYAIVGAPLDTVGGNANQGSAYIFYKSSNGWMEQAKLTANDGAAGDGFGVGVGINGTYAIVGSYSDNVGGNAFQGSAYIYFYNGTSWTQQAKLTASDGASNDFFGIGVSISGDYAIVGAWQDDIGANTDQGSAYIFYRGSGWTTGQAYQAKLTVADGAQFDNFGYSVCLNGDYAMVGAASDDAPNVNQGSAYIFGRIGTSWIFLAQLTASDGATNDNFGYSVSLNGDYAIVGAYNDDIASNTDQGSAYIFYKGSGWTSGQPYQAKLTAADGSGTDRFGARVSIAGDYTIIGAIQDDAGPNADQGSSYLYKRNGTSWTLVRKIEDFTGQPGGFFGIGVGISGYNLIIGAYGKNNNRGEVTFLNFE